MISEITAFPEVIERSYLLEEGYGNRDSLGIAPFQKYTSSRPGGAVKEDLSWSCKQGDWLYGTAQVEDLFEVSERIEVLTTG